MIECGTAWDLIVRETAPLPVIRQPCEEALHCVLAESVAADRDMPPADRAAMDGYAVRAEDIASVPAALDVCGEIAAGSSASPTVAPGKCAAIFTGANVPPGADTVVMIEDTVSGAGNRMVTFLKTIPQGANIFRKGENAREGELLIEAGVRLEAAHVGVCAAVGGDNLKVYRSPTVTILCTGEELLEVGAEARPHQLRNSNGPMLIAALQACGLEVVPCRTVADDSDRILRGIRAALEASDAVIVTGGVSVGKYDLVPDAVAGAGATVHFHGVAMKPGKPLLFATLSKQKCIFGLPGNPLSCMTGFHEFVLPTLRRLSGLAPERCRPSLRLPLSKDVSSKGNRQRHVLGRILWNADGPEVEPVESHGTADLVAGGNADGAVVMAAGVKKAAAGSVIEFRPWRNLA